MTLVRFSTLIKKHDRTFMSIICPFVSENSDLLLDAFYTGMTVSTFLCYIYRSSIIILSSPSNSCREVNVTNFPRFIVRL